MNLDIANQKTAMSFSVTIYQYFLGKPRSALKQLLSESRIISTYSDLQPPRIHCPYCCGANVDTYIRFPDLIGATCRLCNVEFLIHHPTGQKSSKLIGW